MVRSVCLIGGLASFLFACTTASDEGSPWAFQDTLSNGAPHIVYSAAAFDSVTTLVSDLRIGVVEGDPNETFGDVRSLDVAIDGTIYILDTQASEVRAFDAEGRYLRTVASRGEGPGEISEANGLLLHGDSLIWVQDYGQWMMLALRPEGGEVTRVPMHVLSYGYGWRGTVDDAGRFWKPTSHSDEELAFSPEEGLAEGTFRSFMKSYDPRTEGTDSVFLGEPGYRTMISRTATGGYSYMQIPFDPRPLTTVDPGGGLWHTDTRSYGIARLDSQGDTVLLLEAGMEGLPVTGDDRSAFVERVAENGPDYRRIAEAVAALMPETKPLLASLVVDDEGRLWVGRAVPEGEPPVYDVFNGAGDYQGTFRLGFEPDANLPVRIRHGAFYAIVRDELDVPTVVRAPLPRRGSTN